MVVRAADVDLVLVVGRDDRGVPLDGERVSGGVVQTEVPDLLRQRRHADHRRVALRPLAVLGDAQRRQRDVVVEAGSEAEDDERLGGSRHGHVLEGFAVRAFDVDLKGRKCSLASGTNCTEIVIV